MTHNPSEFSQELHPHRHHQVSRHQARVPDRARVDSLAVAIDVRKARDCDAVHEADLGRAGKVARTGRRQTRGAPVTKVKVVSTTAVEYGDIKRARASMGKQPLGSEKCA